MSGLLPVATELRTWLVVRFVSFSLSGRQAWIVAFLVVDHLPFAFSFNPADFSARRMLTGEPFNPMCFATAGIASEPNRAPHRCSKRL
jgi:hypothetical protein